jgi:hypothetical protein
VLSTCHAINYWADGAFRRPLRGLGLDAVGVPGVPLALHSGLYSVAPPVLRLSRSAEKKLPRVASALACFGRNKGALLSTVACERVLHRHPHTRAAHSAAATDHAARRTSAARGSVVAVALRATRVCAPPALRPIRNRQADTGSSPSLGEPSARQI